MAKYRITAPDGRKFVITGGDTPPTQEQIQALIGGYKETETQTPSAPALTPGQRAWNSFKEDVADLTYAPRKALSGATLGASDWALRKLGVGYGDTEERYKQAAGNFGKYLGGNEEEWKNKASRDLKTLGFGYELAGNIGGAGGMLAKGLAKTGLKGLGLASATGGIEGGIVGGFSGDTLEDAGTNAALGLAGGLAFPVGLHYGAKGAKWVARPLTDKVVPMYDATKNILSSKWKLNQLTYDPKLSNMENIWNKVTGRGKSIDDIINEENQRLARSSAKREKIFNARRVGDEAKIRGYVYDGNVAAGRGRLLKPTDATKQATGNNLEFIEYAPSQENGASFYSAISDFKKNSGSIGEQVYKYSPEKYADMRTFLSNDGKTGFAIKDDGDIVSVFNGSNIKGAGDNIIQAATSAGGTKLDAYDTFLPELYSRNGFKEVGRDVWNEEFKSPKWNKSSMRKFNLGEPDVVYMEYDPLYYETYQSPNSLQRVINRLNDNISRETDNIKNVWRSKNTKTPSYSDRSFIESLADINKSTKMRNAVQSGAEDLSERARVLSDQLEHRKNGMYNSSLEDALTIPELKTAKQNYNKFIVENGKSLLPINDVNKFYQDNPIAKGMIEKAREINPSAFKGIKQGSLAEFDELKRLLNAESKNVMSGESASVKDAYKRAGNDLKSLMDNKFSGFRDVNTKVAAAESAQDIFESKLRKGLTKVGGATVSPFWSGLSSPIAAAGIVGSAFNPASLAFTAGGLGGKAIMRKIRRDAGRRIADGIVRTPIEVNINPNLSAGLSATALSNMF